MRWFESTRGHQVSIIIQLEEISNKTGFIKSTLEKVERLLNILEWINNHEKLSKLLALKGGTAILYSLSRLYLDLYFSS